MTTSREKPTFETSDELRAFQTGHWQDLGYRELQRRPDADKWPPAPPVPTRQEIRKAITTLEYARFHSGWIDFGNPVEVEIVARSWGVDEDELRDCVRVAGWGSAALREAYRMIYLEEGSE